MKTSPPKRLTRSVDTDMTVMNLIRLPFRLIRGLWNRGLMGTVRRAQFLRRTQALERKYGIRTEATIPWSELSDNPDSVDYEASGYITLNTAFEHLDVQPTDVFLDLGCGMGRPLVLAATQPFRRVVGVELSEELCEIARSNLAASVDRKCEQFEVIACRAEDFSIPDDVSVIYMFNPFRGKTLQRVIANLRDSLRRRPRDLALIYVLPVAQYNVFLDEEWLKLAVDQESEGLRLTIQHTSDSIRSESSSQLDKGRTHEV